MQMKLPLNITLVVLSGCASWDPGVTGCVGTEGWGEDAGHQKPPHTLAQPPFSPSTPASPHHTHSCSFPPPSASQIPWLTACNAARLLSPLGCLQGHGPPLLPTPYTIFTATPPISQSSPCSIAWFIVPYLQGGEKGYVLQPSGQKKGEQLLSLLCTCAPTFCAHTGPQQQTLVRAQSGCQQTTGRARLQDARARSARAMLSSLSPTPPSLGACKDVCKHIVYAQTPPPPHTYTCSTHTCAHMHTCRGRGKPHQHT